MAMADTAAPRMIRLPGDGEEAAAPGASLARKVKENVALEKLARALIEKTKRPEMLREDVVADLSNWLRDMLAGPALPLNKERRFEEDALGSAELTTDAAIFLEGHPGCRGGWMARRSRRDGEARRLHPGAGSRLRVREEVLRERCVAMVNTFATKKNVSVEGLRQKAADDFLRFWKEEILERRPATYNSYTGIEACLGDTRFLRRSEDIVMFSLGLTKDVPEAFVFLKSAPPPTHTLVVYALIMFLCLWTLPSLASIDEHATIETFTTSVFKEGPFALSPAALGNIRLSFAILCLLTTREKIFSGTEFKLVILPGSKLRGGVIAMNGWRTQGFYTSWAWNLLGLSFLLGGLVPLLAEYGREDMLRDNPWILRAALVSFEVAAPSAMLTSSVVTYALWPKAYKDHGASGTENFSNWVGLLQHNANTAMVLLETTLMGGLPVMLSHASFAPLFAGMYQAFLWWVMVNRWAPDHGPVYPYFFMDTTLGGRTTIFMMVLLAVIGFFFVLFALLDMGMSVIEQSDHGAAPNICCVIFMSYMLMKFKD